MVFLCDEELEKRSTQLSVEAAIFDDVSLSTHEKDDNDADPASECTSEAELASVSE
jgi:hypothetical protein